MNSGNPYTSWPLWHYFTLQFQNINLIGQDIDVFRSIKGNFNVADNPDISKFVDYLTMYDFVNDSIVRLSTVMARSNVTMYTGPVAFTKALSSKTIANDSIVVIKNDPTKGGDMIPFIGTAFNMNILIQGLIAASTGRPYDVMMAISESDRQKLNVLLDRPIYKTTSIVRILTSYKESASTKVVKDDVSNVIARKIAMFIDGKYKTETHSINIEKGTISTSRSDKTIMEFKVQLEDSPPIVIKFAFPIDITPSKRDAYISMLERRFKAVQVHTPSDEDRLSTTFRPVSINTNSINGIFGATGDISTYIAKVNAIERPESIDTSVLLSDIPKEDENDIQDEDEEEDIDYSEN